MRHPSPDVRKLRGAEWPAVVVIGAWVVLGSELPRRELLHACGGPCAGVATSQRPALVFAETSPDAVVLILLERPRQTLGTDLAPAADALRLVDLGNRRPGGPDREEQLRVLVKACGTGAPIGGGCDLRQHELDRSPVHPTPTLRVPDDFSRLVQVPTGMRQSADGSPFMAACRTGVTGLHVPLRQPSGGGTYVGTSRWARRRPCVNTGSTATSDVDGEVDGQAPAVAVLRDEDDAGAQEVDDLGTPQSARAATSGSTRCVEGRCSTRRPSSSRRRRWPASTTEARPTSSATPSPRRASRCSRASP